MLASESSFHLLITVFVWVKKFTPDLPKKLMSPLIDALFPVKENIGRGTGIGKLTPICPASTSY